MGFRLNGGSIQFQLLRSLNLISSKNCAVEWKWLCKEMGKPLNWVGAWWMFQTLPFSVHSLRAAFHKDVRLLLGSGSDAPINNWWLISRCSRSNGFGFWRISFIEYANFLIASKARHGSDGKLGFSDPIRSVGYFPFDRILRSIQKVAFRSERRFHRQPESGRIRCKISKAQVSWPYHWLSDCLRSSDCLAALGQLTVCLAA